VTLVHTRELISDVVARGSAVAAFNLISLEHAEAIIAGAELAGRPAILQVSENAIRYHGGNFAALLAGCRELAVSSSASLAIHLDHIEDIGLARECLERASECGVTSIMFDASRSTYAENVNATAGFALQARSAGLWVEAELGAIGGKGGAHTPGVRTRPADAAAFVAATGVDGLAVAVGSSHAMVERTALLDVELIAELAAAVPVPLVLHGSSGVPDDDIRRAIGAGIRKVNVGTALNIAWTTTLRAALAAGPEIVDPRTYFVPAREEMAAVAADLCLVVDGRLASPVCH
jgi:fructose-bisphosphate aldolase class II